MKNKICKSILFTLLLSMILSMFTFALASTSDDSVYVRVLVKRPRKFNEQLDLKGYSNIGVYDITKSSTNPIVTLGDDLDILLDSYYNSSFLLDSSTQNSKYGPYHLVLTNYVYNDYATCKNQADSLRSAYGIEFYPFYNGTNYTVYAGTFINEQQAKDKASVLSAKSIATSVVNTNNKNVLVYDINDHIVLSYASNFNIYFGSYASTFGKSAVKIDKNTYKGMVAFTTSTGVLNSINKVQMKDYLYGVVANEMSASWHVEALKAQAVAARTYAYANIKTTSSVGYDLQDNQNSQVYGGYTSEKDSSNKAVDGTNGKMIYYDNKLITAYFHSTSGGKTENSENIWVTALPYLKGVDDPYSNDSPYTTWENVATKDFLVNRVKRYYSTVNDIYDIKLSKISENERVLECIISTNVGDITLKKENVRAVFGYDFLLSSWFTITKGGQSPNETKHYIIDGNSNKTSTNISDKYVISSSGVTKIDANGQSVISSSGTTSINTSTGTNANANEYVFSGRGWGHGVGMSQYGAKKMGELGFTYDQILKHYYTGVEIK